MGSSSKRRQSDAAAPVADVAEPVVVKEKKEKKDKKDKKDKKEKKDKKRKSVSADDVEMEDVLPGAAESPAKASKKRAAAAEDDGDDAMADVAPDAEKAAKKKSKKSKTAVAAAADDAARYIVPFAEPLATEEETSSVFDAVRRAARNRALLTGIKETQKALRKASSQAKTGGKLGVLILAADTYPWDIFSHMPVLAEDAGVPIIYVRSRERLGRASGSNRIQTSAMVVLGKKGVRKGAAGSAEKKDGELSEDQYEAKFETFLAEIEKANERVKI